MPDSSKPEVSPFESVDPAPSSESKNLAMLQNILCDENQKMFQRMRALFALRNIGGNDSVDALASAFNSNSALLKHEIAYVLGQMQNSHALPCLIDRLADNEENVMVRHEAAEALGAIGDQRAMEVLSAFVKDNEIVVAESCEVAIDLLNYVASNNLDYS